MRQHTAVEPESGIKVSGLCDSTFHLDLFGLKLDQQLIAERCRAVVEDPRGFGAALFDNLPLTLFLALALVAKVLYLGSGRFYAEHLLFLTHFHSVCFLLGLLILAVGSLGRFLLPGTAVADTPGTFAMLYPMGYLQLALHAVYRPSRLGTLVRYIVLLQTYLVFLVAGFLVTLLWTIATL